MKHMARLVSWLVLARDILRGYRDSDVDSARMKMLDHPLRKLSRREMRAILASDDGLLSEW